MAEGAEDNPRTRVFVGNLAFSVKPRALSQFMAQAGTVKHCKIRTTFDGRSKGCALVEYATEEEARHAIASLTDQELNGRMLFVREDREPRMGASLKNVVAARHGGAVAEGVKLHVSNLAPRTGWQDLKDLVRDMGVQPLRTDVDPGTGEGTITVRNAACADAVLSALQGASLHGQGIKIQPWLAVEPRPEPAET